MGEKAVGEKGKVTARSQKPPLMMIPIETGLRLFMPLRPLCFRLRKYFPNLRRELGESDILVEDFEYIGLAIVNILFFFFLFFGLLFVMEFRVQEKEILPALGEALLYAAGVGLLISYALFTYPKIMAGKKAEEINKNLVFALRDILMQVTSGVPLYRAMVNVGNSGYGQVSQEFEVVSKRINTGTPVDTALRRLAENSQSDYLKRVIWQLVNTIKAGSSLKSALRIIVDDLTLDQRTKIRDYAHELNLWSLVYMIFAVAIPTIGTVMMVIMSAFMGLGLGAPAFIAFQVVCLAIQYALITLIKSRRPMVNF